MVETEGNGYMVIGRSVPRPDAVLKVTGRAEYVSDMKVPGMAYAHLLRSPYPHARIRAMDLSGARALPGVLLAIGGRDLRGIDPYYGPAFKDQPVLPIDRVRYEGEAVAAVVASDPATAALACERIRVEYEELPAVCDLDEALAPGAPLVHEELRHAGHFRDLSRLRPVPGTNICHEFRYERGEVDEVFAGAAHVFDETFTFPMIHHYSLETYATVAHWRDGGLVLYSTTQHPFPVRKELAEMFGLPLHRVRIIVPYIGGAYGNKSYTKWEPLVAYLAREARRPVKLVLSAEEGFRTMRRSSARCRIRTAVAPDGTLLAREVRVAFQIGAYADVAPRVAQKAGYTAGGPYRIPSLRIVAQAVYTNTTPAVAFRGYGVPQLTWAYESQMDEIAHAFGLDPLELRRRNLLRPGETFMPGDRPADADFLAGVERVARRIGWGAGAGDGARATAKGLAVTIKAPLAPSVSNAAVRLHADGTATVLCSTVEKGQGSRSVMAQIAAEELKLPFERVAVHQPDTDVTPFDQATSASRSTTLMGLAVQRAAREVARQLRELGAKALGVDPAAVRLEAGAVTDGSRALSYSDVLADFYGLAGGELIGTGTYVGERGEAYLGGVAPFWEVGMGAAEVALDEETGEVRILRYVSAADVGKALNPQQCEGQDEGAAMMGVGHTLFEEMRFEEGRLLNPSLVDYRVPRFTDLPREFETILVENGDGPGPFGAKGVGESGLIPVGPAVGNALRVLTGIRFTRLPLTPERVWRALRERKTLLIQE